MLLTHEAAADALESLLGMAVGFKPEWDGHDARKKCGVITEAWIDVDELKVRGYLYGHDFPEVLAEMSRENAALGMSYEMVDCHVKDMRATIWTLTRVTFTGAAILLRARAAYRNTTVRLSAERERFTGKLVSEEGLLKVLIKPN